MKKLLKKILVIAMCLSLCAAVTACDLPFGSSAEEEETSSRRKKDNKKKDSGDPEIPDIPQPEPEPEPEPDYPEGPNGAPDDDFTGYIDLLSQYYYTLLMPETFMDQEDPGYNWLADFRYTLDNSDKDATALIGFSCHDYSGDGSPELIIAGYPVDPEWDHGTDIKAIYTIDKNGDYNLTNEGWSRNRQYLLSTGEFYNEGSSGASENMFGTYKLTEDGTGIEWIDFYFSTYNGITGKVEYYHNTSGIWDISVSEKLDYKDDAEFWDFQGTFQDKIVSIDLTPMYSMQGIVGVMGGMLLNAMYADDCQFSTNTLEQFDFSTDDSGVSIVLDAYDDVYDVEWYSVEWGEDHGGDQDFDTVLVGKIGDMAYGDKVVVIASFPGDMTSYVYTMKDRFGEKKGYFLYMSGMDGSLVLQPMY